MTNKIALILLAVALSLAPHPAYAHAIVIACIPRIGSNAPRPPAQLICQFNQPLFPDKISLVVSNAQGERVDRNDTQFYEADKQTLVVSLDSAKMIPGIYTVRWQVTDTLDSGETSGSFQFGINTDVPPTPTAVLPGVPMTPVPVQTGTTPADLISRFLIGAGVLVFLAAGVLAWRMRGVQKP